MAGLHLLTHPLHYALHPNRWLPVVLIIFHLLRPFKVLGFGLGFAIMIDRYKSLLRSLMLRCLVPWYMRPKGLDIEGPDALVLDSMERDKEPDTGPEVLCCNLLV
jgi:hypothetical protein